VHFHFGSRIHAGVANVQSLGWKGKQAPNCSFKLEMYDYDKKKKVGIKLEI
jgi:hypothetical protein